MQSTQPGSHRRLQEAFKKCPSVFRTLNQGRSPREGLCKSKQTATAKQMKVKNEPTAGQEAYFRNIGLRQAPKIASPCSKVKLKKNPLQVPVFEAK